MSPVTKFAEHVTTKLENDRCWGTTPDNKIQCDTVYALLA